jgi:rhamnulokinase
MPNFLAFDLGAESGRAMLGSLSDGKLTLEELHRFLNEPVRLPTGLYWDTFRLFRDICEGLRVAGRERKLKLDGIAVDTWGVDFGLLGADGALIDSPRHYRDPRNNGMLEAAFAVVPRERIFEWTGLQFMQLNSLYQLFAAKRAGSEALDVAADLLFMPDLLNYYLTGVKRNELTIASTSQFYNPATMRWANELMDALGLPTRILGEVVAPGTRLGSLLEPLRETAGLDETPVFATASHDTASAVAAVPVEPDSKPWCYISSGTWSLMGVELDKPLINAQVLAHNFTNEIGAAGKIRFLRNIAGLWPVQECRRAWKLEGKEYSYAELTRLAGEAQPFPAILNPDAFLDPGHMPERIAEFCRKTGQTSPGQPGPMIRAILESLALRYLQVLRGLEEMLGWRIEVVHIVGGGSQNRLLNQFVADATGATVIAGPAEATATGNILIQAMGAGYLKDLSELRGVVRASFPLETFTPHTSAAWAAAYERYLKVWER